MNLERSSEPEVRHHYHGRLVLLTYRAKGRALLRAGADARRRAVVVRQPRLDAVGLVGLHRPRSPHRLGRLDPLQLPRAARPDLT